MFKPNVFIFSYIPNTLYILCGYSGGFTVAFRDL